MNRVCVKCGASNPGATGATYEACPGCGAIYSKALPPRPRPLPPPEPPPLPAPATPAEEQPATAAPVAAATGRRSWLSAGLTLVGFVALVQYCSGQDEREARYEAKQRAERMDLQRAHEARVAEAVRNGRVFIGMTADEVMRSWGPPSANNQTITAGGTSEQWVYRYSVAKSDYVYLRNGVVTSIQQSR